MAAHPQPTPEPTRPRLVHRVSWRSPRRTWQRTGAALAAMTAALGLGVLAAGPQARAAGPALPSSMASTGDSITRAFDVNWLYVLKDAPAYSWSTGTTSTVKSHYSRILAKSSAISGKNYNDAKTGAKMVDLDGQMVTAATQGAGYVTVLMGANDVCTSTIAGMTPTATVESQFRTALTDFTAKAPSSLVFVSSIPNVYQLWSVLHTNSSARSAWSTFGICQSMLAASNTETQRQQVLAQLQADNASLAKVCAEFTQCRWDNLATYNYAFSSSQVSTVDYFHPSSSGQAALASITWAASYWPTL